MAVITAEIKVGVSINCSHASHDLRDTLWRLARVWQAKNICKQPEFNEDVRLWLE
jgi:hypothetical protein